MILTKSRWLGLSGVFITASMVMAGCASSGNSGGSTGSGGGGTFPVTAGVLHAFTGQNAFFGLNAQNACKAAAQQINAAGGIMGHPLACADFDTKGDPADAVPVTNRMLVSSPHLVMVVGPDGSDIPSVLPLLEQAKVPEMNTVGDPRYDNAASPGLLAAHPERQHPGAGPGVLRLPPGIHQGRGEYSPATCPHRRPPPFQEHLRPARRHDRQEADHRPGPGLLPDRGRAVLASPRRRSSARWTRGPPPRSSANCGSSTAASSRSMVTQRAIQGDGPPPSSPRSGREPSKYVTAIAPALQATGPASRRVRRR